ncbi:hypothetical protein DFH08DRAFT_799751 [Mycena albidolilacea]|uniref:Uncharacterized protein n=1 Tax=Mycena albidolilacea TaxID=1033008 RepID=A0AAD7AM57_9AGAR|nr:hypothetical protein DFH08DRAFT_799751 [Mycena albidolilacea]
MVNGLEEFCLLRIARKCGAQITVGQLSVSMHVKRPSSARPDASAALTDVTSVTFLSFHHDILPSRTRESVRNWVFGDHSCLYPRPFGVLCTTSHALIRGTKSVGRCPALWSVGTAPTHSASGVVAGGWEQYSESARPRGCQRGCRALGVVGCDGANTARFGAVHTWWASPDKHHTGALETRRRRIGAASSAGERLLSRFTSAGVLCFCGKAGRCGASAASAEMAAPTPPCIPAARCDGGDLRGAAYRDAVTTARGARGKGGAAGWVWKAAPVEGRCGATPECWNGRIALTCSPPSAMEGKRRATGEYDGCAAGIGRDQVRPTACSIAATFCSGAANAYKSMQRNSTQNTFYVPEYPYCTYLPSFPSAGLKTPLPKIPVNQMNQARLYPSLDRRNGVRHSKPSGRENTLQKNKWITTVEPHRVYCKGCSDWVSLDKKVDLKLANWDRHEEKCPGINGVVAVHGKGSVASFFGKQEATVNLKISESKDEDNSETTKTGAVTYTTRYVNTPSISTIFAPRPIKSHPREPVATVEPPETHSCRHLTGAEFIEYIEPTETRTMGGISPQLRSRIARQVFLYKKLAGLKRDDEYPRRRKQVEKDIPADGNDCISSADWTDTEHRRLYDALKGYARWEVNYAKKCVRSSRCEGLTPNLDGICDACTKLAKYPSFTHAVNRVCATANYLRTINNRAFAVEPPGATGWLVRHAVPGGYVTWWLFGWHGKN